MPVPVEVRQRGQALIEMALVLPIILVFLIVIVDFGFAFDRREVIQHAVREGARSAAVGTDVVAVEALTAKQSGDIFNTVTNPVTVCYVDGTDSGVYPGNAGDSVQVSGEYMYDFIIGSGAFLSGAIPGIKMTPSSQARLEKTVLGAGTC